MATSSTWWVIYCMFLCAFLAGCASHGRPEAIPPLPEDESPVARSTLGPAGRPMDPTRPMWSEYPPPRSAESVGHPATQAHQPEVRAVALALSDAVDRTLQQLDPEAQPAVVSAGPVSAQRLSETGLVVHHDQGGGWFDPREVRPSDRILLLVIVSQEPVARGPDYSNYHGWSNQDQFADQPTPSQDFGSAPELVYGVFDTETGDTLAIGVSNQQISSVEFANVTLEPVSVTAAPTETRARSLARVTPTADLTEVPPRGLRPAVREDMDGALEAMLSALPLWPGNRWTYGVRHWSLGKGGSFVYTETVDSATLIEDDRILFAVSRERGDGLPWYRLSPRAWYLADDDSLYYAERADFLARILAVLDHPPARHEPEASLLFDPPRHLSYGPQPVLRWPVEVGDRWPPSPLGDYWNGHYWVTKHVVSLRLSLGTFDDCAVVSWDEGTGGVHRWVCPGIGLARVQDGPAGPNAPGRVVTELIDYSLADLD